MQSNGGGIRGGRGGRGGGIEDGGPERERERERERQRERLLGTLLLNGKEVRPDERGGKGGDEEGGLGERGW